MLRFFTRLIARLRCEHDLDQGVHINGGMGKMFTCRKCGAIKFI